MQLKNRRTDLIRPT